MGGVHEVDLPSASAGLLHPWLKVLSQEDGLLSCVLLDRLLGRDGDGPGLAPPQSQSVFEEVADLGEAPADAGLLLDDGLGLLGGADRVLQEVLLQGVLVLGQGAVGGVPAAASQVGQASLQVLVEVALHGASGDIRVGGNPVMAQAMALEPEDLHLALDPGVGVMVPVVGQSLAVVGGEGDQAHDRPTCWVPRLLLVNSLWPGTAAYNLCQTGPRRVYHPAETLRQDPRRDPANTPVRLGGGSSWRASRGRSSAHASSTAGSP